MHQFYIISGNTGVFDLLTNGTLILLQPLDRETTDYYQLVVLVQDAEKSGEFHDSATVNINVLDNNDNNPMFAQGQYNIEVSL